MWINGTVCQKQLRLPVLLICSRSALTCSWVTDDVSIKRKSLFTARQH